MRTKTGIKQLLYIAGCSFAIVLLTAGCLPDNAMQPEQTVQVSTAGGNSAASEQPAVQPAEPVQKEAGSIDSGDAAENENTASEADNETIVQPQDDNPYGIDPDKPMIALTFDDGPSKYTWDIVNTLQARGARATFFLIGSQVATHEAAIDYTLANHNEIASHSFGHKNLTKLSDVEVINQIRPVDTALLERHEYVPALCRVPYGSRDERVLGILKEEGKPVIGWSVDPRDWEVKDKDKIVNHILDRVQDGDIVLMHDIYEPTAKAVAELVPALQERGYQLVTVSELFRFRGVTPQPGEYYRSVPPAEEAETDAKTSSVLSY